MTENAPLRSTPFTMYDPIAVPQSTPQAPLSGTRSSRRLAAAFLSAAIPGAGHLLIDRRRKAILLLLVFGLMLLFFWPVRVPQHLAGIVSLLFGMVALRVYATCDAGYHRNENTKRPSGLWLMILLPLALVGGWDQSALALRASGFQHFSIPSVSMEHTVPAGSHVIVDRWHYHSRAPRHADIAVYVNGEGIYLLKRIIALSGETIEIRSGQVSVNGKPLDEPYVIHSGNALPGMNDFGPLKVPAGKVFLMGDNRDVGLDSRRPEIGPVDVKSLRGVVIYTLPWSRNKSISE